MTQIIYRPYNKEADLHFIHKSWSASYRYSPTVQSIPNQLYIPMQENIINLCLDKCETVIFADNDDNNHIYGFCNYSYNDQMLIINWAHLKSPYRKFAIVKSFLLTLLNPNSTIFYTHQTKEMRDKTPRTIYGFPVQYFPFLSLLTR
jgi:Zn-dependent peptidase ImmA (M78 family)